MKIPMKPCSVCTDVDTELMYKTVVDNVEVDHYVCVSCLCDEIKSGFRVFLDGRAREYRQNMSAVTHSEDIKYLALLNENEAVAINFEYADVKIQRIPTHDAYEKYATNLRTMGIPFAIIIRSTYNNQYHCRVFHAYHFNEFVEKVTKLMNEEFSDNRYGEDMVTV